jgi:hypothetical protein
MPRRAERTLKGQKATPVVNETVRGDAMNPALMAERVRVELSQNPGLAAELVSAKVEAIGAAEIAERAKGELSRITGLDADHVSAVMNGSDGWHVTVDLIELRRIPASTDVLAAYQAVFAPTGSLLSYRRTRRYFRDQMMDEQ